MEFFMANDKNDKLYHQVAEIMLTTYKEIKNDHSLNSNEEQFIEFNLKIGENLAAMDVIPLNNYLHIFGSHAENGEKNRKDLSNAFKAIEEAETKAKKLESLDKLIEIICKFFGIEAPISRMDKEAKTQGESFAVTHLKDQLSEPKGKGMEIE